MRRLPLLLTILAFGLSGFAQTTFTAHLFTGLTQPATTGQVCFHLQNYGSSVPYVVGTGVVVDTDPPCVPASSAGTVTGTIFGSDVIAVTGCVPSAGNPCTYWAVEYWVNGQMKSTANYSNIVGGAVTLDSLVPMTSLPVVPAPTGDSTYCRLDGGNCGFLGSITTHGITDSSTSGYTGNVSSNAISAVTDAVSTIGSMAKRFIGYFFKLFTQYAIFQQSPWADIMHPTFGGVSDAKVGLDGVTVGSSALTSASAPFNCSTDVGKVIQVQYAGASSAPLLTTILSCQSTSHVTLATSSLTSATGQMFFWGTDNAAAIQAAYSQQMIFDGQVYIPAGSYLSSASTVTMAAGNVSVIGTCPPFGARVISMTPPGSVPPTSCSTIIDGSNNNTFALATNANAFRVSGLNFLSFPNATGEFIYIAGNSGATTQAFNGTIDNNSFWGKSYAIYGDQTIEHVRIVQNAVGCASVGAIVLKANNAGGHNKNSFEWNYVDLANIPGTACGVGAPSPAYGLAMISAAPGNGNVNAALIRGNISQVDSAVAGSKAIDLEGGNGFTVEENDVESQRHTGDGTGGNGGWATGINIASTASMQCVNGRVGWNNIYSYVAMAAGMVVNNCAGSRVDRQQITSATSITSALSVVNSFSSQFEEPYTNLTPTNPALYEQAPSAGNYTRRFATPQYDLPNFTTVGFGGAALKPSGPALGEALRIYGHELVGSYNGGSNFCRFWTAGDSNPAFWQGNIMGGAGMQFGTGTTCGTGGLVSITNAGLNLLSGAKIAKYNNIATVGNGVPSLVASYTPALISSTASISSNTVYTTPAAGWYRVNAEVHMTVAASGGTLQMTAGYTGDGIAKYANVGGALTATQTGQSVGGAALIYADSGSTIQCNTTSSMTGSPTYRFGCFVEQAQ